MNATIANQCLCGNTQGQMRLVIHGPTWKNTMPYDAHAITVVVPNLLAHGWTLKANKLLSRFEIFSPWYPDVAS